MGVSIRSGDVLIAVDVQNDFVDGALAVPGAPGILPAVEDCIAQFEAHGLPVLATRDWHPASHCSFRDRGGPWPAHCVQGTHGAAFAGSLQKRREIRLVSKGTDPQRDAYSGFDATRLDAILRDGGARRLFVCGLATDYCVRATVLDALRLGYVVFVITDAIAAVNVKEGDGPRALEEMRRAGACCVRRADIGLAAELAHG